MGLMIHAFRITIPEAIWFPALAAADYLPCPDNFPDVIVTSSFWCSMRWQSSEVVQPAVQPIAQSLNSGSGSMAKFLAMLGQTLVLPGMASSMGDPWGRAENIANILAKALVGMCRMASRAHHLFLRVGLIFLGLEKCTIDFFN